MNRDLREDVLATGAAALLIVGAGTGIYFLADKQMSAQAPPALPPPRVMTFSWTNAPGAVIADVWGRTNMTHPWYHIGRFTNETAVRRTNIPAEFYWVSHPNMVGHYWDIVGQWRVNYELLNITNR